MQVSKERLSPWNLLKEIGKKEGIRGLFKGNLIHLCKSSPEKALKFGFYEKTKSLFHETHPDTPVTDQEIFISAAIGNSIAVIYHFILFFIFIFYFLFLFFIFYFLFLFYLFLIYFYHLLFKFILQIGSVFASCKLIFFKKEKKKKKLIN